MAAGLADRLEQKIVELSRELWQLALVQSTQIGRIVDFIEQAGHQWLRSAIQSAISASRRAPGPKPESAACALARKSSTRSLAAAKPSNDTYVGFPCAASFPAVLPSVVALPSTSRTSSTTWNANPTAEA